MGVSAKPKTKTSTTTNQTENVNMTTTNTAAPSAQYAPYINSAANAVTGAYGTAEANNAAQLGKIGGVQDYYGGVMGGKYLEGNPYLQKMIDLSARDIDTAVDSNFESAGRYGSGMHSSILARELADMEAKYRYGNYATERGYQDAAGGKLIQSATIAAALPQLASTTYADQVAALLGKYGTTTSNQVGSNTTTGTGTSTGTQSGGLLQSLLGAGAQAAGAYFGASDRRLKTNIVLVRRDPDGLGWYNWNWKTDPSGAPVHGVIADEVEKLRPWAFVPNFRGEYAGVNYGAL